MKILKNERDYELRKVLGQGDMGVVHEGWDPLLERQVAVKIMFPDPYDEKSSIRRFFREARALAVLEHPNIVQIYDFGVAKVDDKPQYFIVIEYANGDSLEKLIDEYRSDTKNSACDSAVEDESIDRKVPDQETLRYRLAIFYQILEAMEYAHGKGVVHRDLKPGNIMVNYGHVKIVDFGLALIFENHDVTLRGDPWGTPPYCAPEQMIRGLDKAGEQADIYSLGAVLFELVTGHMPYEKEVWKCMDSGDYTPMYRNLARKLLPPPKDYNPNLPSSLEKIILRCLQKAQGRRFEDLSELRTSFEDCLDSDFGGHESFMDPQALMPALSECASLKATSGRIFHIAQGESITLGRNGSAGVNLKDVDPEKHISRNHGRITRNNGHYFYEDLNSSNGSYLNGIKLASNEKLELHNGDKLRLGHTEFTFVV